MQKLVQVRAHLFPTYPKQNSKTKAMPSLSLSAMSDFDEIFSRKTFESTRGNPHEC